MTTDALTDRADPSASDATDAARSNLDTGLVEGAATVSVNGAPAVAADNAAPTPALDPTSEQSAVGDEASADREPQAEPSTESRSSAASGSIDLPSEQSLAFFDAHADRVAASYRPSWAPPQAAEPQLANTTSSAPHSALPIGLSVATTATEPHAVLDKTAVPGIRPRRQGTLMAIAAVVCFAVLAALAVRSGRTHPQTEPTGKTPTAITVGGTAAPSAPADLGSAPSVDAIPPASAIAAPIAPSAPAALEAQASATEPAVPSAALPPPAAPEQPVEIVAPIVAAPLPTVVPRMTRVRISTSPKNAELLVDGTRASNPFDARLPAGTVHQIHAQAEGHIEQDITLTLDRDRTLAVRLNKSPVPQRVALASTPRPRTATARRRTARPVSTPAPSATRRTTGAGFVSDSPY